MLRKPLPRLVSPVRLLLAVVCCVLGMASRAAGQLAAPPPAERAAHAPQPGKLPEDVERVLGWLPEETEAILVSRGNVPIVKTPVHGEQETEPASPPQSAELPGEYQFLPDDQCGYQDTLTLSLLDFLAIFGDDQQDEMTWSFFGPRTASLFLKAVWWEKDATRATCDIILFRDNTAQRLVDSLATFPNVPRTMAGVCVLEYDLNRGRSADWSDAGRGLPFDLNDLSKPPNFPRLIYVAAPQPNTCLFTTNTELMQILLERMQRPGAKRALPPELPEWRYLDLTVPAWGLRHYRPATAEKDCLSMLNWDPKAQGLVFFGGNQPSQFLGLRYVSDSEDAGSRFVRMQAEWLSIRDRSRIAPMQRVGTNCLEIRMGLYAPLEGAGSDPLQVTIAGVNTLSIPGMYLPWLGFSCPRMAIQSR